MELKIAVLRGINVGRKRRILMADLRALCESLGFKNVKTYIQSGNILFNYDGLNATLEDKFELAINDKYGYEVPVIIKSLNELETIILKNPFVVKDVDNSHLYFTFLKQKPTEDRMKKILEYDCTPDEFIIDNQMIFLNIAGQYHKTKLNPNFFEKRLGVVSTARNWRTIMKLLEMGKSLS